MKTFVVAFIGWHDHNLKQEIIHADNSVEAMLIKMESDGWGITGENLLTEEDVKEFAFNCDHMISAFEVNLCSCP